MPYNFVTDSFHIKKLCSSILQVKCNITMKKGRFAFSVPFNWGLRVTYDVHLRLIAKLVVDLL